ncbi:hypothetical protein NMY22_g5167 [Coprinellus aureogranulatus]|nr:hypothetical protein NMY22_g5167 [Coprinellus aureogranulatus]
MNLLSILTPIVATAILISTANAALDAKIKARGKKYFGTIIDVNTLGDGTYTSIANSEFGAVTAEYSFKWNHTEPNRGAYTFTNADAVSNWATSRGKFIRGHTLVWHQSLPTWVTSITDKATLTQIVKDHITTVVGRYKGKVYAWDVVNELFEEDGHFRNSHWFKHLGESFIDTAFQTARAADPSAKLYINEYNLDYAGPKINALLALVNRLKSRGVPIDGIGSQAHLTLGNVGGVPGQLKRIADTGLEVAITELDIRIPVGESNIASKLKQQRQDYETVVNACLQTAKCVGISAWGITDKYSWVPSTIAGYDKPNMWDNNYNKKEAYTGVDQVLGSNSKPAESLTGQSIYHNHNTAKCVEVRGNNQASGAPVQTYDCNGSAAQKWTLVRDEPTRSTKIRLSNSNLCVDAGSNPANNALVKIWQCYDGLAAQAWLYTGDNRFQLANTNLCLDLPQGSEANGNQLQLYSLVPPSRGAVSSLLSNQTFPTDRGFTRIDVNATQASSGH